MFCGLLQTAVVAASVALTADGREQELPAASPRAARLLVVLIGGMDSDPTAEQIAGTAPRNRGNSGMFQLAGDLRGDRVTAEYFNWNGTRAGALNSPDPPRSNAVADFVRDYVQNHPRDRIALVGNSWGGHTALEVAQQLFAHEAPVAVNLVVFLDASSAGRGIAKPQALPLNVNRAAHYFTRNVFAWGRLDAEKRLENIDLGDPASGFMRDGRPAYNARFDFQAHVAAEWDERIHADIRRRLLALLPDDAPAHAASAVRQRH